MNQSTDDLVPIEQREVVFYDDTLTAVRADDGQIYVSIRQMCSSLGVNMQGQTQRIRRHSVLSDGERACRLETAGGVQSVIVLRVDLVPLWLSGIRAKAVKEEIRPKLERFQREAARVLWDAFRTGALSVDDELEALLTTDSDAARSYKMMLAMTQMARQQLLLESRLNRQGAAITENRNRIESIEAQLGQGVHLISSSQAGRISQAVKAIAISLGKRSGRNEFGGVYGELYRRFEIAGYRELPAAKFQEAMKFLSDWYGSLESGEVPF